MKYLIAIMLAIIILLSSCRTGKGETKPHVDQKPVIIKQNIDDLKNRVERLKDSQGEVLENAARVREMADNFNLDIDKAKVVLKVSDEFEVSPEILLRGNITP